MDLSKVISEEIPLTFFTYIRDNTTSRFKQATSDKQTISTQSRMLRAQEKGSKRHYAWQQLISDASKHSGLQTVSTSNYDIPVAQTTNLSMSGCSMESWNTLPKPADYRKNLAKDNPDPFQFTLPSLEDGLQSCDHETQKDYDQKRISLLIFWDKSSKKSDSIVLGVGVTDHSVTGWISQWTIDEVIDWYTEVSGTIDSAPVIDAALPKLKSNIKTNHESD